MNDRSRVWMHWAIEGVLLTSLGACASYDARPLRHRLATQMVEQYESDGFVLSARMVSDPASIELYFGEDLLDEDILPIEIYVQNTTDQFSYTFTLDDFQLCLSNGQVLERVPVSQVVEELSYSHWYSIPFWLLAIYPGYSMSSAVSEANADLSEDYFTKALEDLNLAPGNDPDMGVLFFRPKVGSLEDCVLEDARLNLEVARRSIKRVEAGGEFRASLSLSPSQPNPSQSNSTY